MQARTRAAAVSAHARNGEHAGAEGTAIPAGPAGPEGIQAEVNECSGAWASRGSQARGLAWPGPREAVGSGSR